MQVYKKQITDNSTILLTDSVPSQTVDIGLIVTSIIFGLLIIIGSVYFLVYFQHPDDKWVAWFPKVVVVLSMSLAAFNIFLLPLDVANQKGEFQRFAIPMTTIQLAFYIATTVIVTIFVPFTVFYYEGENDNDESDVKKSGGSQIGYAIKWLLPTLIFIGAGMGVMYVFIGFADIPLDVITGGIYNSTSYTADYCSPNGLQKTIPDQSIIYACRRYQTNIEIRVSVLVYIVALITLAGWVVFSVFGGVGLVALPFDLINEFIHRPKPITSAEYQDRKKIIGQQAQILMEAGKTLMDELRGGGGGQSRFGRRYRTVKNRENEFRKDVMILEYHFRRLEESYRMQGGNLIIQIFKLIAGCIGSVLSICWVIHIAIYVIPMQISSNPVSLFLNDLFRAVGTVPFIGTALYALFSFYLLFCVIKGNTKLGMRILLFTVHPMTIGETMMNSLVFNAGIILLCSMAVAQFCASSFSNYAMYTATQSVFSVQIQNLRYLSYLYKAFIFILIGCMAAFGWDAGQVYQANVFQGENLGNEQGPPKAIVETNFLNFLRNFRLDNSFLYRDQLSQNLIIKQHFIEVDFSHIVSYDEELANHLKDRPAEYLPLFENAIRKLAAQTRLGGESDAPECQVMILSNSNPIPLRELDTMYMSKLVRISGIIIASSPLQAKATHIHIMCKTCRSTKVVPVNGGLSGVQLPRNCDSPPVEGQPKDCPMDPYVIVHDKSKFVDMQTLKLQETRDMIPVGELPRHMLLSCDRYLTNKVVPGTRVTVTGIMSSIKSAKTHSGVGIRAPYIRVVGMQVDLDAGRSGRTFTEEEEEEFLEMSRRPDLYEQFANSIAPSIFGNSDIKKAIACLLFSGSKTVLPDGMKLRGDINVLLLGDPGTAKSQLLKFVEQVAPIAVYTSGKGSSAAGLTAAVVRDSGTRDFHLEGGAMVLADGGVVCIDEFDKMNEEDRVAIHEAMEQQTISIAKAGITTILNSRTSVLAAANPVFGRYDDMKSATENIDFQSTILSRFDLIFIVKDEHNEERDRSIARHVVNVHMNVRQETATPDIDIQKMRSYISYCKSKCAPRLSPEASQKLSAYFMDVRSKVRQLKIQDGGQQVIPITVRQLEAIIRISESLAKMTLSPVADESHVDEAIRLFGVSTINALQSGQVLGFTRKELRGQVDKIVDQITRRLPIGSSVSVNSLMNDLRKQDLEEVAILHAIDTLTKKETLVYENKRLKLKRVAV
ncbi:minichromosome maintenance protein 5 [Nowakowskiella sp. JEL0407]|nr:minichromosome maintenance protein 5 [Nowakowskiella sp. JEL0407]